MQLVLGKIHQLKSEVKWYQFHVQLAFIFIPGCKGKKGLQASANLEMTSFLRGLNSSNPQPNDPTFVPLTTPDPQVTEQFSGQSVYTCGF